IQEIADKILADEEKIEYVAASNRCFQLAVSIRQWLSQELNGQVYWVETDSTRVQRVSLVCAPIDVGPALREQLYTTGPTVVMTSATLSSGGRSGFEHFKSRLGLSDCSTALLGSPFNYPEQAELHLFTRMPDPSTVPDAFEDATIP